MRKGFQIFAFTFLAMLICSVGFAASTSTLSASATLSGPTGVNPVTLKVMGTGTAPSDWADTTNYTSLNFDPLTLFNFPDPVNPGRQFTVFLPDHFFSIDCGYTYGGGAAISQISFSFLETAKPAGQPNGLGNKATATLVRKRLDAAGNEVTETTADRIAKVLLRDVGTVGATLTQLAGGWLRVYVGVVTKDPALPAGDVERTAAAEVFSPGDLPGTYSGTLTVTSL